MSLTSAKEIVETGGVVVPGGIGASEIAAVLDISPYSNPWEVWARHRGLIPPKPPDHRLRCGKAFQRPIAQMFSEDTNLAHEWWDKPYYPATRPYARVTVDAFVPEVLRPKAVLEVKTAGLDQAGHWDRYEGLMGDETGVPEFYQAQLQYQLGIYGLDVGYVAVEINHELRYYQIEANEAEQEFLFERAEEFWRKYIQEGVEPPPGRSEEFYSYIRRKHPRPTAPVREATPEEVGLLDEYANLRAELKPKLDRKKELENELTRAVGDADGIESVRTLFTWKRTRDKQEIDWEALAKSQLTGYADAEIKAFKNSHLITKQGYRRIYFKDLWRGVSDDE